jgi:chorismate synthase
MTNGEDVVARVYAKPIPTSYKRLPSFDMKKMKPAASPFVRSDVCVIPALSVIAEAVAAWEIFDAFAEKFGSDSIDDMTGSFKSYVGRLKKRGIR